MVIATYDKCLIVPAAIGAFLIHPIALHRVSLQWTVVHKPFHLLVHQRFINTRPPGIAAHSAAAKEQGEKD